MQKLKLMLHMRRIFFLFIFSLSYNTCFALVVFEQSSPSNSESCSFNNIAEITGKIEKGDAEIFKTAMERTIKKSKGDCLDGHFVLQLDSIGGDVEEAIKIGRLVRKYNMQTFVNPGSNCSSACVFILAGGVRRNVVGKVGIHRPHFTNLDSNLSVAEIRKQRDQSNTYITSYLKEVDISQSLFDAMNAIAPDSIRYLSYAELDQFQLNGVDATFDEYTVAQRAKLYGTTSSELRRRDALANAVCKRPVGSEGFSVWSDCNNAILFNVDVETYKRRILRSNRDCVSSDTQCVLRVLRND